jgi:hypothetical protein
MPNKKNLKTDKKNEAETVRHVDSFALFDQNGRELTRHGITGIVLLAHPNQSEIEKLPKDDKGHYPIISYQFGDPKQVLALLQTMSQFNSQLMEKWVSRLEKDSGIILPDGGDKNGN